MKRFRFLGPFGFLLIVIAFSAIVMLLWNWLMPVIFGLDAINFWQALGLFILARILFGGFGFDKHKMMGHYHHKNHIRDKWMRMSPDQREKFVRKMNDRRRKFGFDAPFGRPPFDMGEYEDHQKEDE